MWPFSKADEAPEGGFTAILVKMFRIIDKGLSDHEKRIRVLEKTVGVEKSQPEQGENPSEAK